MNSMHCLVAGLEFRLHYSARTNRERRLRQAIENRMFELQFSPPCVSIQTFQLRVMLVQYMAKLWIYQLS